MTLDEAIKHAEEVAEEKENEGKLLCQSESASIGCLTCAEEHRQLAEWLKELKQYKKQANGDLISRESVITMLNKIENAIEDGDGFQFNEWIEYAKDIPSAEKTAEWISVLEQIKEELSHISKPEIDKEDYENGVYDGVNLAIRTIDKYAGELVHTDISLIKKDILSELEELENYPSKDNDVFAQINTYKRCIGIIDKHIGELEQTAEWIEVIDEIDSLGNKTWHHKCSICGNRDSGWGDYKYCPNCGAKMVESEKGE